MTPQGKAKGPDGRPNQMVARLKKDDLQAKLQALTDPAANAPVAFGVRDAAVVADTEIRIRGEAEKFGPVVPRGYLSLLDVPGAPAINPKQSGRLELAQWLTSDKNPLTSRVMANRIWQHLFGQGLVAQRRQLRRHRRCPSQPGTARLPGPAFHAGRLVRQENDTNDGAEPGLSAEQCERRPPTSRPTRPTGSSGGTVRAGSTPRKSAMPCWPSPASSSATARSGSPAQDLRVIEMSNVSPIAKKLDEQAQSSMHRSVYLPLLRTLTPRVLEVFDFAEQGMVTGSRDTTTVAPQALYLLNDPFVQTAIVDPGPETSQREWHG